MIGAARASSLEQLSIEAAIPEHLSKLSAHCCSCTVGDALPDCMSVGSLHGVLPDSNCIAYSVQ